MNTIWKSNLSGSLGTFEWYKPGTREVQNLGPVLDICVRAQVVPPITSPKSNCIMYLVEVLYSRKHIKGDRFDAQYSLAHLKATMGDDARICLATFKSDKFGQAYRLALHEQAESGYHTHSLTIDNWVWDNGCQPLAGK